MMYLFDYNTALMLQKTVIFIGMILQKTQAVIFLLLFFSWTHNSYGQYDFKGQISQNTPNKTVYLSIIEDYRKLSRISVEQIIKRTQTDSLGFFQFTGNNLPAKNRIYRIHVEECSSGISDANHFFGNCENSTNILFIANNEDTVTFPINLNNEMLCDIRSTNAKASAFMEIDVLKEHMAFDFMDFRSEANRKLNLEKWFTTLQDFGSNLNEPLADLYIYDFLSDKRNETYAYYLEHLAKKPDYYNALHQRLKAKYPDTPFTRLYETEIAIDKNLTSSASDMDSYWKWILGLILSLSLLLNIFLIANRRIIKKKERDNSLKKLTSQEQKIVHEILKDKTNKEIASILFVSLSTVKTHINNLYKKLGVSSRDEIKALF